MEDRLIGERDLVQPGSLWRHWKGGLYRVLAVALRESDQREQVVYEPASGTGPVWTRDLCQWHLKVTPMAGEPVPRFSLVSDAPNPGEPGDIEDVQPCGRPVAERGPEY